MKGSCNLGTVGTKEGYLALTRVSLVGLEERIKGDFKHRL